MSLQVLTELHHEVRRLFIAGSGMAAGDLRLEALLPQLEKLGASAPVLARLAEGVRLLLASDSETSAARLLDVGTLLHAVLYTQGRTDAPGEPEAACLSASEGATPVPYRKLKPVIDALTDRGAGRLELVRSAFQEGVFLDLRTHRPAVLALEDSYTEIADLIQDEIIPAIGPRLLPLLREQLNLQGGKADARKLYAIHHLQGAGDPALYIRALEEGAAELRNAAVAILGDYPSQEERVLEASRSRKKELREAALLALSRLATSRAVDRLMEVLAASKEPELAVEAVRLCADAPLTERLLEHADKLLAQFDAEGKPETLLLARMEAAVAGLRTKRGEPVRRFLQRLLSHTGFMSKPTVDIQEEAAATLLAFEEPEALAFIESMHAIWNQRHVSFALRAAVRTLPPEEVYARYAPYLQEKGKPAAKELLHTLRQLTSELSEGTASGRKEAWAAAAWDPRWLDDLIRLDDEELAARFAPYGPHPAAAAYLIRRLEQTAAKRGGSPVPLLQALLRMEHEDAFEQLVKMMELRAGSRSWWYIEHELRDMLRNLPARYAGRLEQLAGQAVNEGTKQALLEAAQAAAQNEA